jgi:hypothetical protein
MKNATKNQYKFNYTKTTLKIHQKRWLNIAYFGEKKPRPSKNRLRDARIYAIIRANGA